MTIIPSPEQRAHELATDIERFAQFVRANPEAADQIRNERFLAFLMPDEDPKARMAHLVRQALRAGATVDKAVSDNYAEALLRFGSVTLQVYTKREAVCERVVTGTHEEIVEEKDPEALAAVPTVKHTVTVEDVEWVCSPILAATEEKAPVTA